MNTLNAQENQIYKGVALRYLARAPYETCWQAMRDFTTARDSQTPDELWIVEHPAIYTQGLAGKPEHLLRETNIPLVKTDRGGQITYHGPGQIVIYPLVNLRKRALNVRQMVRVIEAAVCDWLALFSIEAFGSVERPGVYVKINGRDAKIASLGLKVTRGFSYHGVSVNYTMPLDPFLNINPCGYAGLAMTRVKDFVADDKLPSFESAGFSLAQKLIDHLP